MTDPTCTTYRTAQFVCHPDTTDDTFETLFDTLPSHYWDTWRERVFGTLHIMSRNHTALVGGWPWWVPAWFARRSLAAVAAKAGVSGDCTVTIERSPVDDPDETPDPDDSSIDTLTQAASLMWARATLAREQGRDRWQTMSTILPENNGWLVTLDQPDADWDTTIATCPYDYEGNGVAPHIAAADPIVMLAVAAWLDAEAAALKAMAVFKSETVKQSSSWNIRGAAIAVTQHHDGELQIHTDTSMAALAVATAYLRTPEGGADDE